MAISEQASKNVSQLLSLPIELKAHIINLLPYPTLQVLYATHPYFREVIDLEPSKYCQLHQEPYIPAGYKWKPPYISVMSEMTFAAKSDPFLSRRKLKPCAYCIRLRSVEHFSKNNMKPKRDYSAFCIDCGIDPKHNLYHPGARCDSRTQGGIYCGGCYVLKKGYDALMVGEYKFLCRRCGEMKDTPRRLEEQRQREEEAQRVTAARKATRRERNARLKETAGSDFDDWKSVSTLEETPSEADFWLVQSEAEDYNYD
ncbi:hypothetical protein MMC17_008056 [Xylographa soralifera]|nr:hypothetical protein [Xylographa soralifera]